MRFRIFPACFILILLNATWSAALETKHEPYVPGEVLVKFKPGLRAAGLSHFKSVWRVSALRSFDHIGVDHFKLPAGLSVEKALEFFKNDPQVEYAEPNYIYHLLDNIPNDPLFVDLWGQNNTGQTVGGTFNLNNPGLVDADMDLPAAWMMQTDCSQVIVAVLDTGIDYNHPDLASNIWINPDEIPDNGIDDDNNGYVDDAQGWDFVSLDKDPMDYHGHGTHVAGTIAAQGNNNLGVAGVCWGAKVMAVRVLNTLGFGSVADIITGLTYAGANGAEVINLSLGGSGDSQALKDAIDASPALVVCAAGNSGENNDISPEYPASYTSENIIAVAAGDQADALALFSNYGLVSVDVMAPGTNIESLSPARQTVWTETFDDGGFGDWTTGGVNDTWGLSGAVFRSSPSSLAVNPGGDYLDNTDAWAMSPPLSLAGKFGCILQFYITGRSEPGYDEISIQASADGISWITVYGPDSGSSFGAWLALTADLTSFDDTATFWVRLLFTSDFMTHYEGFYFDDLSLTCHTTTFNGNEYKYYNGTSMATPHVAGLAALIKAHAPALNDVQIKRVIEMTVDQISGLEGKIATGGRVNAARALELALPTADAGPDQSVQGNSLVTLNGTGSGLSISYKWEQTGGVAVSLSNDSIAQPFFTAPAESSTLIFKLTVTDVNGQQTTDICTISVTGVIPPGGGAAAPAAPAGGGGGGGGCFIASVR